MGHELGGVVDVTSYLLICGREGSSYVMTEHVCEHEEEGAGKEVGGRKRGRRGEEEREEAGGGYDDGTISVQ